MKVPRLERATLPSAGPSVQLAAQAPGQPVIEAADDIQRTAGTLAVIEDRQRKQRNRVELAGLEARMVDAQTKLTIGAQERRGRDAFGVTESTLAEFDKQAEEIGKDITDADLRTAYQALTLNNRSALNRGLATHESEQRTAYEDETTKAQLSSMDNLAATDPSRAAYAMERKRWAIKDMGARKGLPTEAVDAALLESDSTVHRSVVKGMLNAGRYAGAKDYLEANRAGMTAADIEGVEAAVREGSVRAESQEIADGITAKHKGMAAALEATTTIKDPDVRAASRTLVRQFFADQQAARALAEEQATDAAWDIAERTGDVNKIPVDVWMSTPGPSRSSIRSYLEAKASGRDIKTDFSVYYEAKQAAVEDPAEFAKLDLRNLFPALGDTERKELINLQADIRQNGSGAELLGGLQTETDIVNGALASIGIDPTAKEGSDDATKALNFRRQVSSAIRAIEATTKKRASRQDVEQMVDKMVLETVIPYSGFIFGDDKKALWEVTPEDIRPEERRRIEDALRSRKQPVTEEAVWNLFLLGRAEEAGDGG